MENKTKYYVNKDGEFLGGFCGANAPEGSIEVECPEDGRQVFDIVNNVWLPAVVDNMDRLKELDELINAKSARIIEDLALGNDVHQDVQALFDERQAIRDSL